MLEGSAHIFTNDADAKQLNSTKRKDQYNDGGVTGDFHAADQPLENNHDHIYYSGNGRKTSQPKRITKGLGGVSDNAFNSVVGKLTEAPFCLAGIPGADIVGDEFRVVTDPGEDTLGKTMIFSKFDDAVPHTAAEGTEITGIRMQGHIGQTIDQAVKTFFEEIENSNTFIILSTIFLIALSLEISSMHKS